MSYNGWSNYETWAVALWIDNDAGLYQEMHRIARRMTEGRLADHIKSTIEDGAPDLEASLYSDLLNAALSKVDWYEVAQHYIEEED